VSPRWLGGRSPRVRRGEWVGLGEIWSLYYGPVLLARFDEREMKFYG